MQHGPHNWGFVHNQWATIRRNSLNVVTTKATKAVVLMIRVNSIRNKYAGLLPRGQAKMRLYANKKPHEDPFISNYINICSLESKMYNFDHYFNIGHQILSLGFRFFNISVTD